ncbi:Glutathione synthetase [Coemansia sp. RSA 552]|nr:Glutathione synthetase [Coemansia sp. RSA 552]
MSTGNWASATTTGEFLAGRPEYTQDAAKVEAYRELATDWQATHGLVLRAPDAGSLLMAAPVSLGPSPIPRREFSRVVDLQPRLNLLFERISRDHGFLVDTLRSLGTADEFTARIFAMYMKQYELGIEKPGVVGIHRSDYLIHAPEGDTAAAPRAKQVEFNTIAASFAALSAITGDLHRFLLARTGYQGLLESGTIEPEQLPANESLTSIGDGIAAGFALYGSPEHGIAVERLTFAEMLERGVIRDDNRLFVGDKEVAVAYYRSGYAPTDFSTDAEWDGRWLIERSRAIPIPSLAYHLAGCKKIQQVLAQPGVVERFIDDQEAAAQVRQCFVGLYPLDGSKEGLQACEMAISDPDRYVVKPQREGGGYNTYGADIPRLLGQLTEEERKGYILMDLIRAPGFNSMLLRNGQLVPCEVVSELGIYGIFVSDREGRTVVNRHGGHLLRTKASDVREGGVAAGFAVIDSPLLV